MRENVARAIFRCFFHPAELPENIEAKWHEWDADRESSYRRADAAIAVILAELETPSVEMCRAAIVAWDNKAVKSDEAGMAAALQAAAAHLREQSNG